MNNVPVTAELRPKDVFPLKRGVLGLEGGEVGPADMKAAINKKWLNMSHSN